MKSVWNGSISFGLVNIPVKLYSAIESKAADFKMLHDKDHGHIQYKRFCEKCGKEVDWEHITKGVEIEKNKYYIIDKKTLENIKPESSDTIEIVEFVDSKQIDPIYFDSHYFVGPSKEKEKTYFLFKEILSSAAKVAIGKFVMREKEHICAIESYNEGLLLTTLNYKYEIRDISEIEELKEVPTLKKEELELAKQLINKLFEDEFEIGKFKDTFEEKLKILIKKKEKGEVVTVTEKSKKITDEKNLVEALKASLK